LIAEIKPNPVSNRAAEVDALKDIHALVEVHVCGAHSWIAEGCGRRGILQCHVTSFAPGDSPTIGEIKY